MSAEKHTERTGNESLLDLQLEKLFQQIGGVEMESSSETPVELEPPHYVNYLNGVAENVSIILALIGIGAGITGGFLITGEVNTHNWGDLTAGAGVKLVSMGIGAVYGALAGSGVGLVASFVATDLI